MKKFEKIKVSGKIIEAEICDTILKRARGLMFRKNPSPLLFIFKKPTMQPIHSFFCKPFKAIWILEGKIIEEKIVFPFEISIRPNAKFTKLVEIPLQDERIETFSSS